MILHSFSDVPAKYLHSPWCNGNVMFSIDKCHFFNEFSICFLPFTWIWNIPILLNLPNENGLVLFLRVFTYLPVDYIWLVVVGFVLFLLFMPLQQYCCLEAFFLFHYHRIKWHSVKAVKLKYTVYEMKTM